MRTCTVCGETKEDGAFTGGYLVCKECRAAQRRARYQQSHPLAGKRYHVAARHTVWLSAEDERLVQHLALVLDTRPIDVFRRALREMGRGLRVK